MMKTCSAASITMSGVSGKTKLMAQTVVLMTSVAFLPGALSVVHRPVCGCSMFNDIADCRPPTDQTDTFPLFECYCSILSTLSFSTVL
jgi:hypothetical protein